MWPKPDEICSRTVKSFLWTRIISPDTKNLSVDLQLGADKRPIAKRQYGIHSQCLNAWDSA
jgi:hypothetical protein